MDRDRHRDPHPVAAAQRAHRPDIEWPLEQVVMGAQSLTQSHHSLAEICDSVNFSQKTK
jgi:hypothetical protein